MNDETYCVVTMMDDNGFNYLLCDEDGLVSSFESVGSALDFIKEFGKPLEGSFMILNMHLRFKVHRLPVLTSLGKYLCQPFQLAFFRYSSAIVFGLSLDRKLGHDLRSKGIGV